MNKPPWLPDRLEPSAFTGLETLEVAAWSVFQRDFAQWPLFRGETVTVSRVPHKARPDREHTYWHLVTEGEPEEARQAPMPDRLERIPWARPVIENEGCPSSSIKVWSNQRHGSTHVCIWFDRMNWLVVLKQLSQNYLLKTTYCPEPGRREQLHKEYARWKKSGARL